jgi:4-amino-4-deoxy-L-arabinose transferase-like glycosyltransferase
MTDAESSTDFLSAKTLHLKIVAVLMICGLFAVTIGYSAHEYVDFDEAIYLIMGRNMAITGCPMNVAAPESVFVDSPPLIPYFASALQWAGVESIFWIRTFHVTLWVLPCLIGIYLLGLRLFHHPAVGLLALLLFSTRWFVFQEAARVKLDVPLASLSTLFLLCLYEIDSPTSARSARFAQIGLVCFGGIACLIKHQGILFPFAGLLFLLIRKWQKNASAEAFRAAAKWVIGAIAIPTITWLLILASCWEDFQIAEFGRNFMRIFHQTNEPSFNMPLQEYWLDLARKVLGPVTLFGIMMTVLVHWRLLLTDSRLLLLSLWSLLFIIFCSAIGLKSSRYFIAAMPAIVLLIASVAAPGMWERFLSKRKPVMKLIRFGFVAIVLAGCSY